MGRVAMDLCRDCRVEIPDGTNTCASCFRLVERAYDIRTGRVKIPRAFRAFASKTYGWRAGDFDRLIKRDTSRLVRVLEYWESKGVTK